jgi:hypothetical protein
MRNKKLVWFLIGFLAGALYVNLVWAIPALRDWKIESWVH